ncbi:HEPN domain-containing protein [Sphingosinicella sp. LY1275]|uniref:HEPN domain-containing protein n=1 Tax=Sphingosinicella sp. LY1275 TaxID=3095379 RepID=UPI002ADED9D9|nr:HEPN domain-containing protein [Sphingosinicella sp. LY1275]MEA1015337.1 HEPN domain-containing protein [Sphingosinicella sp. LY1275]
MTNRKQQLIDDVGFIFTECVRVNEALQAPGGLKNLPKSDWMFELPHPSGTGKMICGRAAAQRLEELARSAIRRSGLSRQVDVLAVRRVLGDILVRKFLKEKRGIEISQVERALAEAGRMAAKGCSTITHFLPCHLMIAQQPASFDIGPVRFHSRASFRSLLAKQLRAERGREVRRNKRIIFDVVRYFKTFGWVAEVAIQQCDGKTSSPLAEQAVTAALNCLHLLLGAGYTHRMAVGGPAIDFDKRGGFSLSAGGSLTTSAVYGGGPGEVAYEDDWFSMFDRSDYKEGLRLCGIALEVAVDPRLTRPLSDRFLDAALWFGEAVREKSPAAKVVKYVTAIERMLMTDEKDDITTLVSERLAALCCRGAESREQLRDEARRLYSLRSKLVHGSLSPNAEAVHEGVKLGADLAQDALLAALVALGELGLRDETATTRQLGAWYDMIITRTDRIIAEQAAASDAAA